MTTNKRGSTLIVTVLIISVISAMGVTAMTMATTNIRISNAFETDKKLFYSAEAGIEHARDILRVSTKVLSFSSLLLKHAGQNKKIDPSGGKSDDIPLVDHDFMYGHYSVFLLNDIKEGEETIVDMNNKIMLRSVATIPSGQTISVEVQLKKPPSFDFRNFLGTITLLGKGSEFYGNKSSKKLLSGNDAPGCGNISKPVFSVLDDVSSTDILKEVNNSIPHTFTTHDMGGVVQKLSSSDLAIINKLDSLPLDRVEGIKKVAAILSNTADLTVKSSGGSKALDMGTSVKPKIIVAQKDFVLESSGSGILLVKGTLTIKGNVDYKGLIIVIGDGVLRALSGVKLNILGGVILSNINSPLPGNDKTLMTIDDEPGKSIFDLSRTGSNTSIIKCSKQVDTVLSLLPLPIISFCDESCISLRKKKI